MTWMAFGYNLWTKQEIEIKNCEDIPLMDTCNQGICSLQTIISLEAPQLGGLFMVSWSFILSLIMMQSILWYIEICDRQNWEILSKIERPLKFETMSDRLIFRTLLYSEHRREARLDSIFGFKSWNSEDADNFSSMEDEEERQVIQCSICLMGF